jgi:hypothetical protein
MPALPGAQGEVDASSGVSVPERSGWASAGSMAPLLLKPDA